MTPGRSSIAPASPLSAVNFTHTHLPVPLLTPTHPHPTCACLSFHAAVRCEDLSTIAARFNTRSGILTVMLRQQQGEARPNGTHAALPLPGLRVPVKMGSSSSADSLSATVTLSAATPSSPSSDQDSMHSAQSDYDTLPSIEPPRRELRGFISPEADEEGGVEGAAARIPLPEQDLKQSGAGGSRSRESDRASPPLPQTPRLRDCSPDAAAAAAAGEEDSGEDVGEAAKGGAAAATKKRKKKKNKKKNKKKMPGGGDEDEEGEQECEACEAGAGGEMDGGVVVVLGDEGAGVIGTGGRDNAAEDEAHHTQHDGGAPRAVGPEVEVEEEQQEAEEQGDEWDGPMGVSGLGKEVEHSPLHGPFVKV